VRGNKMAKKDQIQMQEGIDGNRDGEEKRVRQMHVDCRDAAQSVTHLDVLAYVVAS